ncbi:MAG: 2-oxo acid dehydrogenase subunit E2, partial [Bifidobacteriaceae bacterium]|nr:2-oxo acid dehydrogenase subunit E2 [Bifidobacteriaceae bacterium]
MTAPLLTFALPDPGEGLTEAEITRWLVAAGDPVAVNQPVVEIETAKSVVELPSPFDGVVVSLAAAEGAVVPVGQVILSVRPPDAVRPCPPPAPRSRFADVGGEPVLVGYGPGGGPAPRPGGAARAQAKPPVRALARQLGIDLGAVAPTGPQGTVSRQDVQAAAALPNPQPAVQPAAGLGGAPAAAAPSVGTGAAPAAAGLGGAPAAAAPGAATAAGPGAAQGGAGDIRQPIRSVRRATARAMVESAFSAPHATLFHDLDATRGLRFAKASGVGVMALAELALARAARLHPLINASWDEPAQEIVYHRRVNL